jgi:hypothetical protein
MDVTPILIVGIVFGSIVAIILGPSWLKSREKQETQITVRNAIDKGQPLPPELVDALTKDVTRKLPSRMRDIRQGIIWLAVAVGMAAFSLVTGDFHGDDWRVATGSGLLGLACIPGTVGVAFIVLSFFNKNKD